MKYLSKFLLAHTALVCFAGAPLFAQGDLEIPQLPNFGEKPTSFDVSRSNYSPGEAIRAENASIQAIHKIQMAAQTDGLIRELPVDEFSVVKADDTVLVIDSRISEAELAVAQKQKEAAKIVAEQNANIEFSKKSHELASEEYKSIYQLQQANAANISEVRRKWLEREKAKYSIDMAIDEQEKAKLDAAVAEEQAKASQVKLEMSEVKAPFEGIIVERMRDVGEWIRAGEPVFRLIHLNEMKVVAYVPLRGISPNDLRGARMDISVAINSKNNGQYQAVVEHVSPEISNDQAMVVAKIKNQKDINGHWVLSHGMRANVSVTVQP